VVPFPQCAVCDEWLHFYVEGATDPGLSRTITAHLEGCPRCAARLWELEAERLGLMEALGRSPALSSRFPARVVGEIRRRKAEEKDRRLIRRLARLGLGAAGLAVAAAIALVCTLLAGRGTHAPSAPSPSRVPARVVRIAPDRAVPPRSLTFGPLPCPDDGLKTEAIPATLISLTRSGPRLSETIEFSATILRQEDALPCTRDINNDGQTNVSDAAHLFMLSMAPPESVNPYFARDDLDLDCNPTSACLIY